MAVEEVISVSSGNADQFGTLSNLQGVVYEKASGDIKPNGVYEFDQPIVCRYSTFVTGNVTPTYGLAHPDINWALAQDSRWEQLNGDWVRITTRYAGAPNPGILINSSSSQTRTEPIAACPKFNDILGYLQTLPGISSTNGVSYDTDANGSQVFKGFDKTAGRYQGVESYDEPGAMHSVSYASQNHSDRWSSLYMIDEPKGDPPPVPDGVNWRLVNIEESQKGYIYDIKETWESSGPNGWDPVIYGTATYTYTPGGGGSTGSTSSGSGTGLAGDNSSSGSSSIGNFSGGSSGSNYSEDSLTGGVGGDPLAGNGGFSEDSLTGGGGDPLGGDGYDTNF